MDKIKEVNISEHMEKSFIDYSMSVIVQRALPDVRDGLKPVHRRIVYSMHELRITNDKPHKKSARIVGEVMGKYHPHGDSSIYEAMVRMAQDFSYRMPLVDGHGNFGSMDGDGAAAPRYTEARLTKLSEELVRDIEKKTVDLIPSYTNEDKEPVVLPSRFPNLLVNGSMGIAVGMATNIPPHNLGEVIDGLVAYIANPEISNFELMDYIKGPDFPTGGIILGNSGIKKAFETGRGSIIIRGRVVIEENSKGKSSIIITEIPYQVNKATMQEKIADLVNNKIIEGISEIRDESSDRNGVRVVIELKRDANTNVVLNGLYKHSPLQVSFGINTLALVDNRPRVLPLNEIYEHYLNHQRIVIRKRTEFDLEKALNRAHLLEGFKIALDNIDEVINIIKTSSTDKIAKDLLMSKFSLTEAQVEAILEMKLRRLTGLERDKILEELKRLLEFIDELRSILASEEKILEIIKTESLEIKNKYSDARRTEIDMTAIDYIEDEALIPNEPSIITLTNSGYIKRLPIDTYKTQNRGGVGVKGITTNDEDFVTQLLTLNTHDFVMFFTNKGKVYRIKGYGIPEFSRQAKGLPIVNLLPLEKEESINSVLIVEKDTEHKYIFFTTKQGLVKRCELSEFDSIRVSGKIAITLKDDDELISAQITDGTKNILLATNDGRMAHFNEEEIRIMGRSASGVRGINTDGSLCVGSGVVMPTEQVFVVTEKGYGKRTPIEEYRQTHRGGKGVKTINITDKNGVIVAFKVVKGDEDVIIVTEKGITLRLSLEQISIMSRVTQGVRLINLKEEQKVSTVSIVDKQETEEVEDVTRETLEETEE